MLRANLTAITNSSWQWDYLSFLCATIISNRAFQYSLPKIFRDLMNTIVNMHYTHILMMYANALK